MRKVKIPADLTAGIQAELEIIRADGSIVTKDQVPSSPPVSSWPVTERRPLNSPIPPSPRPPVPPSGTGGFIFLAASHSEIPTIGAIRKTLGVRYNRG